jgi:hypothetical protein
MKAVGMTCPENPSEICAEGQNFSVVAAMPQPGDAARAIRKIILRPSRLRDMAAELEAEADYLRRKAEEIEDARADKERADRRRRLIRDAALDVVRGADLDAQARRVSLALTGERSATPDDMRRIIAWECQTARTAVAARRDREIMLMARHGWTNAEIAAQLPRLGFKTVHPKSISRIIQQCLRGK